MKRWDLCWFIYAVNGVSLMKICFSCQQLNQINFGCVLKNTCWVRNTNCWLCQLFLPRNPQIKTNFKQFKVFYFPESVIRLTPFSYHMFEVDLDVLKGFFRTFDLVRGNVLIRILNRGIYKGKLKQIIQIGKCERMQEPLRLILISKLQFFSMTILTINFFFRQLSLYDQGKSWWTFRCHLRSEQTSTAIIYHS